MALNLHNTVLNFLQEKPDQKFTTKEIATWIFETYPEECKQKQQRSTATVIPLTTDADVIAQIAAEISSQGHRLQQKAQIKTTEGRPRKYYFTTQTDENEVSTAETGQPTSNVSMAVQSHKEPDPYPKLSEYLRVELGVYSKRIDERKSLNKQGPGGNKWLYPDLAGMEVLSQGWHQEIVECVGQYADRKTILWSFEVKLLINRSNVREVFFQTVSNSSWANLGYLVAAEFEGRDTIKELRILASLHGIGVIRLDRDNPTESEILIPARERTEIDWNTANRLVIENTDFKQYITLIRQFYQTNDHRPNDWDFVVPSR